MKGAIAPGQLADLAVLSADYFAIPEDDIKRLESVLTIVGGAVVHGSGDFAALAPRLPSPAPDWSPVPAFGSLGAATSGEPNAGAARVGRTRGVVATAVPSGWTAACGCWAF